MSFRVTVEGQKTFEIAKECVKKVVYHTDIPEDSDWIQQELETNYPQYNIYRSSFGPVIAAHLGSGGIGLGYIASTIRTD